MNAIKTTLRKFYMNPLQQVLISRREYWSSMSVLLVLNLIVGAFFFNVSSNSASKEWYVGLALVCAFGLLDILCFSILSYCRMKDAGNFSKGYHYWIIFPFVVYQIFYIFNKKFAYYIGIVALIIATLCVLKILYNCSKKSI
jgi:hypothetical protein